MGKHQKRTTITTTVDHITVSASEIFKLVAKKYNISTPVSDYKVTVEVPSGGDYSGMVLKVGEDTEICVEIKRTEQLED